MNLFWFAHIYYTVAVSDIGLQQAEIHKFISVYKNSAILKGIHDVYSVGIVFLKTVFYCLIFMMDHNESSQNTPVLFLCI